MLKRVLWNVTALLGVLSATMVSFHSVSPTAAYLLVPYFGWTLYATGLTFAVYKMNPRVRTSFPDTMHQYRNPRQVCCLHVRCLFEDICPTRTPVSHKRCAGVLPVPLNMRGVPYIER